MGFVHLSAKNAPKTYLPVSNFQPAASKMVAKLMAQELHRRGRMSCRYDTRILAGPREMRGAWEKCTCIYPSTCTLSSSSYGAKAVLGMNSVCAFLILVPHKSRETFWPACLPRGRGESCRRQLWDQTAGCSRDKKNPHGGTSTLIYSCDRLGMVQWAGSGMRLINSCVWRKQTGLLAALGCMAPPSRCHPHPLRPLAPAALQVATINSVGVWCLVCSGDL